MVSYFIFTVFCIFNQYFYCVSQRKDGKENDWLGWACEWAIKNVCFKELYDTQGGNGFIQEEWKVKSLTKFLVYCTI